MSAAKSKRNHRAEELIQQAIANVLRRDVQDQRLSFVTITGVDLSPDFKQAIVFFSLLDPKPLLMREAENAFKKAAGFFRASLAKQVELRHTPNLVFRYDPSVETGARISDLLRDE